MSLKRHWKLHLRGAVSNVDPYPFHKTGAEGLTTTVGTTLATHACSAVQRVPAAQGMASGKKSCARQGTKW